MRGIEPNMSIIVCPPLFIVPVGEGVVQWVDGEDISTMVKDSLERGEVHEPPAHLAAEWKGKKGVRQV